MSYGCLLYRPIHPTSGLCALSRAENLELCLTGTDTRLAGDQNCETNDNLATVTCRER